jgi:hypothetical protein
MDFYSSTTIISYNPFNFGKNTESMCFKTFYKKDYGLIDWIESSGIK